MLIRHCQMQEQVNSAPKPFIYVTNGYPSQPTVPGSQLGPKWCCIIAVTGCQLSHAAARSSPMCANVILNQVVLCQNPDKTACVVGVCNLDAVKKDLIGGRCNLRPRVHAHMALCTGHV